MTSLLSKPQPNLNTNKFGGDKHTDCPARKEPNLGQTGPDFELLPKRKLEG